MLQRKEKPAPRICGAILSAMAFASFSHDDCDGDKVATNTWYIIFSARDYERDIFQRANRSSELKL